ncbi:hypothetical protein BDF21DRAFT_431738 [Thamnidium elegans]|uniref:Uncharacterized protein n=1 Tax=Thamnidium elegans TaxID=101142 RepID=A0A8H7T0H3_9FUNG|nr:hypothetical protein INT48_002126 [Thamnidium elegans]KAI8052673.1 hypothetical protein BDF21DRAFT_431738 [Thamnidium elegans]
MGLKSGLSKLSRRFVNILTCNSTKRFGNRTARRSNTGSESEKALASRSNLTSSTAEPTAEVSPSTENIPPTDGTPTNDAPTNETDANDTNATPSEPDYSICITTKELQDKHGALIAALEEALGQTLRLPGRTSSTETKFPIIEALFAVAEQCLILQKIPNENNADTCVQELARFKNFFEQYGRRATSAVQGQETTAEQAPVQERPISTISTEDERPFAL